MKPIVILPIPPGSTAITFGPSWWAMAPVAIGAIALVYVPILGAFLSRTEAWVVAVVIAGLGGVSLIGHVGAHLWAARATGSDVPARIPLYPLGDAAQVWPAAPSAWRDALVAGAGPLASFLVAGLAYLLWNAQLNPYLNVITFFLVFFNGGLAVVNLTPTFPQDGGRLMRAIGWGLLAQPVVAARLGVRRGYLLAAVLVGWAIFLLAQRARVSLQTSAATLTFAGLIWLGLWRQPAWQWDRPVPPCRLSVRRHILRAPLAGLLTLSLWGITLGLLPTNNGLEAPGLAASVAPMVTVPPEYRHPFAGAFLLTTVVPQTPIIAGEWLYGQLSPAVKIVSPEQILPPDTTAQTVARQQYRMLEDSETTAVVVGLRLAGYPVKVKGLGARVLSILPDSPARGILQPDDVITGLNDGPVSTTSALIDRLKTQKPETNVQLRLERSRRMLAVPVVLMPPGEQGQAPRLGIRVESAGIEAELPFPVKIEPQKVAGGPSAGLMFALTIYNMLTPEDLTGGRIIAGTGTINLDGMVGPIGGVQQKVAAAELAGAEYFLSPPENYKEAQAVARHITVIKVETAAQAIQFLRRLPPLERQS